MMQAEWSEFGVYPAIQGDQSLLWVEFPLTQIQLSSIVNQLLEHPSPFK